MSASQRDYRILTGTAGWKHSQWGEDVFYPDDLPEDWYLSFYANEFPIVLLPNDEWQDQNSAENIAEEIEEQATAGFKCILECMWANDHSIAKRLSAFKSVQHVVTTLLLQVSSADFASSQLVEDVISFKDDFDVCVEVTDIASENEQVEISRFCEVHNVSLCWSEEGDIVVPDGSPVWIARCNSQVDKKQLMLNLKTIIAEQFKRETLTREHIIIMDGQPPQIEAVRNAIVMMELM